MLYKLFHRHIYLLLIGVICVGWIIYRSYDVLFLTKTPVLFNGTATTFSPTKDRSVERKMAKKNSDKIVLEDGPGAEPVRSPLDRSLVSGVSAPEGSDEFILFKLDANNDEVKFSSPEIMEK